jgi:hypothetical protein
MQGRDITETKLLSISWVERNTEHAVLSDPDTPAPSLLIAALSLAEADATTERSDRRDENPLVTAERDGVG